MLFRFAFAAKRKEYTDARRGHVLKIVSLSQAVDDMDHAMRGRHAAISLNHSRLLEKSAAVAGAIDDPATYDKIDRLQSHLAHMHTLTHDVSADVAMHMQLQNLRESLCEEEKLLVNVDLRLHELARLQIAVENLDTLYSNCTTLSSRASQWPTPPSASTCSPRSI